MLIGIFVIEHLKIKSEFPQLGSCEYRCSYTNLVVGTSLFSIFFSSREQERKTNNFHAFRSFYARFVSCIWLVTCFYFSLRPKSFCKKVLKLL